MWQQTCKFLGTLVPIQKASMYLLLRSPWNRPESVPGRTQRLWSSPVVTQNGVPNIHSQVEDVFKNFLLLIRVISFPAILGKYHKKLAIWTSVRDLCIWGSTFPISIPSLPTISYNNTALMPSCKNGKPGFPLGSAFIIQSHRILKGLGCLACTGSLQAFEVPVLWRNCMKKGQAKVDIDLLSLGTDSTIQS